MNLKTKDIVMIALMTALYIVVYMLSMVVVTMLGPFGHAISPGIGALIGGSIIYFMSRKVGKMWQFTILSAILMGVTALMGAGYLPWVITTMVTAVIADLIASRGKDTSVFKLAIASGIMHVGQAFGAIIPSWFFLEKYRADWIARGQTAADMDAMIKYTSGILGVVTTVVTFALSFIGIYIAYYILRKHFKEK